MKKITVFTPTFNRAYSLPQLYNSLVNQTNKEFIWLVIDDGSSDDTRELVQTWIDENKIEINYIYKQNGGMHTAHNTAYKNITSEYNICIDSDDYMPINAIEKILLKINSISENQAGIIGLDADVNGEIIGSEIPEKIKQSTLNDLYTKHQVSGDKKLIIKTSVVKQFEEYPEFKGEKLVPLGSLYLQIDQKYKWLCSNEVYCIVEYLPDGSSNTIFKQYKKSPRGFAYNRNLKMQYSNSLLDKFKNAMHLVSSSIFAKDSSLILKSKNVFLVLLAIPFGVVLNFYIRYKINFSK